MTGTNDTLDRMPPWDAAAYFQAIKETAITPDGSVAKKVVMADSNRVAILFSCANSTGSLNVSTKNTVTSTTGFFLSGSGIQLQFLFFETGPLCQQEWWLAPSGFGILTVVEVLLTEWPQVGVKKGVGNGVKARAAKRQRDRR